jgi:site-specific DNA-methyltransferase (adenine-specific)
LASTKPNAWILDPFTGSSTTGIAANLANRRFLGIDREEEFLIISKNRKLEIENPKTAATFRQKIDGFNNKKELELFLVEEPKEEYKTELNLTMNNDDLLTTRVSWWPHAKP